MARAEKGRARSFVATPELHAILSTFSYFIQITFRKATRFKTSWSVVAEVAKGCSRTYPSSPLHIRALNYPFQFAFISYTYKLYASNATYLKLKIYLFYLFKYRGVGE